MTDKDQVNKLFRQFKNKNVLVELRDNNQAEGKIIAIDNYLNIVLENDNGIEKELNLWYNRKKGTNYA